MLPQLYFILVSILTLVYSQTDGNPHKWDRKRRCDGDGYNPPCGLCEGYGGMPWSDEVNDIKLTQCTPVADAGQIDPTTLALPYFKEKFTNTGFYEILIGIKENPFCIGSFPGPDSHGPHCYQPQQGTFYYDWTKYQLRIDYTQQAFLKNTTLSTFHTKGYMWIVIDYNLLHQCVCTDVGRRYNLTIYPVNPKFMEKDSRFIGRERLMIEYIWKEKLVDHWVKGPHHIWVDVETGNIIRMWQPFNGLEVFDPEKWTYEADNDLFAVPPSLCKKGGALWRINCDDNGNYIRPKN